MSVTVRVDLRVYSLDTILRACHAFTARGGVSVHHAGDDCIEVTLGGDVCEDEIANALLDAHLRARIADETRSIRELLVAQAFCEADLLDRREIESDIDDDPRGILRTREASR